MDCFVHGLEMFEFLIFPLCEASLSFPAGLAVFRAIPQLRPAEDKAKGEVSGKTGYPNFGGTRKFETEGSVSS